MKFLLLLDDRRRIIPRPGRKVSRGESGRFPVKILHCSDIHLGRRPIGSIGEYSQKRFDDYFRAFGEVVDAAVERRVDAVVIAGDLFDKRDLTPDVLERAEEILEKLCRARIPVILTEGNHDKITDEGASWLLYLRNKGFARVPLYEYDEGGGVVFSPETIGGVRFYGLGYSGASMDMSIAALRSQLEPGAVNVVVAHTAASPEMFFPGLVRHEALASLEGLVTYFAGGHIHQRTAYPSRAPFFFTPGSTEYWELDETGEKGYLVFDTASRACEFVETRKRAIRRCALETEETHEDGFRGELLAWLDGLEIAAGEEIVLVTVKCPDGLYIDTGWCAEQIEKRGALKAKVSPVYRAGPVVEGAQHFSSIEMVERQHILQWERFSTVPDLCVDVLRTLKALQEENRLDECRDVFDSFLDEVAGGGGP